MPVIPDSKRILSMNDATELDAAGTVPRIGSALAMSALFLSGAAGLVYELCWIRRGALVFGSTIFAVSTVVAAFFLGLSIGSAVFGRLSLRMANPMRSYAVVEVVLAIAALLTTAAFSGADAVYGIVYRRWADFAVLRTLLRILLVSAILLPPAVLMGATLPLAARFFVRNDRRITRGVGDLYAVNTLGAAAGCLATGFILLPGIGATASVALAASMNLLAALLAAAAAARWAGDLPPPPAQTIRRRSRSGGGVLSILVFLVGFVALANEVLWTRFLSLLLRNTTFTYTITLAVVLGGIVAGGLLAARMLDRARAPGYVLGILVAGTGLSVLAVQGLPPGFWARVGRGPWLYLLILFPASVLSGAALPVAVGLSSDHAEEAGSATGRILAVNTLGGILGSLAAGFFLLPEMGLQKSVWITTGIAVLGGLLAWTRLSSGVSPGVRIGTIGIAIAAFAGLPRISGVRVPRDFLAGPGEELVAYREGLSSNVAVVRRDGALVMEIDGWWQGEDRPSHQIVAAHLPALLHRGPERVLVIGVGAGQTPSRFLMHPTVRRLDCVDIEPAVFDLLERCFDSSWMRSNRVRLLVEDGRNYVAHTGETYDVISLELGQLFRPGAAAFYTVDFYRLARARLRRGGVLAQFVPLTFLSVDDFRGIVRSFLEVFPCATLWYNTSELLLIGFRDGESIPSVARLLTYGGSEEIRRDLRFSPWNGPSHWLSRPETLAACFLVGPDSLRKLAGDVPPFRDDRAVLEYDTARREITGEGEIRNAAWIRKFVDPIRMLPGVESVPLDLAKARVTRDLNLGDLVAAGYLDRAARAEEEGREGDLVPILRRAVDANPWNAVARRLLGEALLLDGRAREAALEFRRVLEILEREDDPKTCRGLGAALYALGRFEEAIPVLRIAAEADPRDWEILNALGVCLAQTGNIAGAVPWFEKALAVRPGYRDAQRNLDRARRILAGES